MKSEYFFFNSNEHINIIYIIWSSFEWTIKKKKKMKNSDRYDRSEPQIRFIGVKKG